MSFKMRYVRTLDVEGKRAIIETYGDLEGFGVANTGSCSLKVLSGLSYFEFAPYKQLKDELDSLTKEYLDEGEPLNLLAYIETENTKLINNLVKDGFVILEILPGGHDRYEMALMCYTMNTHEFSTEEEIKHANA